MSLVAVDFNESGPDLSLPVRPKEMISTKVENGRTHVRINSSSLGVIQECLRKSQYLLHEKWKPESEAPATVFGSAIHKALEVFYRGSLEERELPDLGDMELMSYGHMLRDESPLLIRATRAFIDKAEPLRPLPDTDKRSIQNGVWILHNYFKAFLKDPYIAYTDEFGPFVEREFSHILHEDPTLVVEVFGTIDIVLQHVTEGTLILADHKTTSFFGFSGSNYFDREKPNHQYSLYALGARRVFGIESDQFVVNVVEVKARPKTARGSGPSFPRQITTRTEEDFEELREVIMKAVWDYIYALKSGVWPMGPIGACTAYGGCPYKSVCSSPKNLRQNILNSKFRQETQCRP